MGRNSAVVILMVLSTACAHDKKPETQPQPVAAATPATATPQGSKVVAAANGKTPAAPTSTAKPAPATTAKAAPPSAQKPRTPAKSQAAVQTAKAPATTPQQPTAPPKATAPPTTAAAKLDLEALKTELKDTKAIGLMTKLSLKNKVDDLLDEFRKHHSGKPVPTIAELRRSYDLLMMKVLSLLQDRDQKLASEIVSSREQIWGLLADPKKFAALPV